MYYPVGWPRILKLPQEVVSIRQVINNRDKLLYAVLTDDSLSIWFCKVRKFLTPNLPLFLNKIKYLLIQPCLPIVSHRRDPKNVEELGANALVQWRPDSSMLVIAVRKQI